MSLPIAVNIDGGEGGRIAQSAEQKELDFCERRRYLIDTLSKRRDGISSLYPDLLDPSFGSCLRRGIPERRQKEWWPDPESNWGHGDFQSPALPTELSCHLYRPFSAPTSLINTGFRNFQARALKFFSFFTSENDYNVNVIDLSGRRRYIMHVLITTHANRKSEDGASQLRFGQAQSG